MEVILPQHQRHELKQDIQPIKRLSGQSGDKRAAPAQPESRLPSFNPKKRRINMKTIVLYFAVVLIAAITVTGCRKDVPVTPTPMANAKVMDDHGGETPPQLPPRKLP